MSRVAQEPQFHRDPPEVRDACLGCPLPECKPHSVRCGLYGAGGVLAAPRSPAGTPSRNERNLAQVKARAKRKAIG